MKKLLVAFLLLPTPVVAFPAPPTLPSNALNFLEEFFYKKPQAYVLEFGSGGSTIWMALRTANLYSVEHNEYWHNRIVDQLKTVRNPVHYYFVRCPYYTICTQFPNDFFDLVIVDGRSRKGCIAHSLRCIKPGGALLLNDSHRRYYTPVFPVLEGWKEEIIKGKKCKETLHLWTKPIHSQKNQAKREE